MKYNKPLKKCYYFDHYKNGCRNMRSIRFLRFLLFGARLTLNHHRVKIFIILRIRHTFTNAIHHLSGKKDLRRK